MHVMMNQIFVVINYSMFTRIFLLIVTAYVSRGLSTYFGTERTSLLVRRLEIVLLDDGMARIQHIGFVIIDS